MGWGGAVKISSAPLGTLSLAPRAPPSAPSPTFPGEDKARGGEFDRWQMFGGRAGSRARTETPRWPVPVFFPLPPAPPLPLQPEEMWRHRRSEVTREPGWKKQGMGATRTRTGKGANHKLRRMCVHVGEKVAAARGPPRLPRG